MTRKQAREQAFILIFEKEISKLSVEEVLEVTAQVGEPVEDAYTLKVFPGVFQSLEEIDQTISAHLTGWTIQRLSKVALSLLRLAIFEMKYMDDIPVRVSINEAVELCKTYATQEDASYVNGVLGAFAKKAERE